MKRWIIDSPGSYYHMRIEEVAIPRCGADEVLVRIAAFGVNFADCCVRMGLYGSQKLYAPFPCSPGFEYSGEIVSIGSSDEVSRVLRSKKLAVGSKVFGVARFWTYAEYVVVAPVYVYAMPSTFTFQEIAGFPAVYLTAYYACRELAAARRGHVCLVHSAAGGVGIALCRLLKNLGCIVVGVVGASHKVSVARAAGCDAVIDKSSESLWVRIDREYGSGFDSVYDANGVETLQASYDHLAPGGRLIVYGFHTMLPRTGGFPNYLKLAWNWFWTPAFDPLKMTGQNRSVMAFNLSYLFDKVSMFSSFVEELIGDIEAGRIAPSPVKEFDFDDARQAHIDLESAQSIGKLVVLTEFGKTWKQQQDDRKRK